jgi:polyphosphate kinase
VNDRHVLYGFVSTGNLNERTAKIYADHCLMTAHPRIMGDVSRIFNYLENSRFGIDTPESAYRAPRDLQTDR